MESCAIGECFLREACSVSQAFEIGSEYFPGFDYVRRPLVFIRIVELTLMRCYF